MRYQRSRLMQERLADNRQRILLSARKLVSEGGFRAAQIAAVATDAGLSTGSIYRYFPSKAELFVEVLGEAVRHEIDILRALVQAPGSAAQRLQRAVESFAGRAFDGPFLAYAFIAEPADQEVDAERIRARRAFGDVFETVLHQGIASGEFPPQNADVAAACIVGAFTEALIGPIGHARGSRQDRGEVIRTISRFCLQAVSGRQEVPAAPGKARRRRA
ncbi:TetR/AcrR family transcriptional regulator [Panacagrimonas sp.]|uniref:TetR/AcrR family transcriptional regulator n=1 Tax=Panacagrimonas sp. TaxID=2480088 RepID=UPI003B529B80